MTISETRKQVVSAACKRCLQWALREGEVKVLPVAVCSLATVRKCVVRGWLEECGQEVIVPRMGIGFTKFRLTPAGYRALEGK